MLGKHNKIVNASLFPSRLSKEILDSQWRNFRTSEEFESELKTAGFSEVVFHYDKLRVFPTEVAKKL